jgi:hypothetical protein
MSWGMCVQRNWRGYDLRLHPTMMEDGFQWEPELALIDDWLEDHNGLPPVNVIEIHPTRVLLLMRDNVGTIILNKTADGLRAEEP